MVQDLSVPSSQPSVEGPQQTEILQVDSGNSGPQVAEQRVVPPGIGTTFDIQELLNNPSVQELSEANVTESQWLSILMACDSHATSGMIKAQIKCLALEVLIISVKLSEEDIVAVREVLEEAEEEFLANQRPVEPQTKGRKADRNNKKKKREDGKKDRQKQPDMRKKWKQNEKKDRQKKPDMRKKWKQDEGEDRQKKSDMRKRWKPDDKKDRQRFHDMWGNWN
ncbi:RNA-binding protein 25-like [Palaemon carinicauda]|uniref:RNA-binding protein 25-like n=1 Tax=Palaemon carinicauda TaxID=392227 RepID=UPI0035B59E26